MTALSMPELLMQTGLDELIGISTQELAADFMAASVVAFSDGDLLVMHEPYDDGVQAVRYGHEFYHQGQVVRQLATTALENGMKPGPIYDFQRFVAEYFDNPDGNYSNFNTESSTRIYPEAVTVDGNPILLPRVPGLVIDYGACLTGRSLISDQLAFLKSGARPFTYTPLTRLHYTNRVLLQTYDKELGSGATNLAINRGLYIGREDGIRSATDEMIAMQAAFGKQVEVADVIICNGGQHTTTEDIKHGARNAYTLMREAGIFIIRSLAHPSADEAGTDQIAEWAFEAGFREQASLEYSGQIHNLGHMVLSGEVAPRTVKTVVLTK